MRCGALDGCLTGALAATSTAPVINSLITGGKLVQATSPTAASTASIAQLKQQAIASNTYVIGKGRIELRGDNTTACGTVNTFRGLLYALNDQRHAPPIGDAATPAREVIRIDRGARQPRSRA